MLAIFLPYQIVSASNNRNLKRVNMKAITPRFKEKFEQNREVDSQKVTNSEPNVSQKQKVNSDIEYLLKWAYTNA